MRRLPTSVRRAFIVRPVQVISRKLSKTDRFVVYMLLWNISRKLVTLYRCCFCCRIHILRRTSRRTPGEILISNYVQILIWLLVRHAIRPELLSTELDRRHTARVINCCKQTATVKNCC